MGCGDVRLPRTTGSLDFTRQERAALNKLTMAPRAGCRYDLERAAPKGFRSWQDYFDRHIAKCENCAPYFQGEGYMSIEGIPSVELQPPNKFFICILKRAGEYPVRGEEQHRLLSIGPNVVAPLRCTRNVMSP